jgi:Holliday junction resolvasome RuvABC endonuclease subunit
MTTRLQEKCAARGIEYASIHSLSLKKAITGSGKASKIEMIKAAEKIFKRKVIDDNEADALLLLEFLRIKGA